MKHIVPILFFILIPPAVGQIKNYEAKGNLESKNPLDCVPLSQVTNMHTPADMHKGLAACLAESEYEKAANLLLMISVYGDFDTKRVADRSAHQGLTVLSMRSMSSMNKEQSTALKKALTQVLAREGREELCAALKEAGPPKYHPSYLIQHGLEAFFAEGDGLVEDFDSDKTYEEILTSIGCK